MYKFTKGVKKFKCINSLPIEILAFLVADFTLDIRYTCKFNPFLICAIKHHSVLAF